MSVTVLVTRPKGDEAALTNLLHERGYNVIHEPLTHIYLDHTKRQPLHQLLMGDPDAIIITSRHAVHALAMLSDFRDIALVCVGEATAKVAESQGFSRISVMGGTVEKMAATILASYDEGSRFVYVSGEHVRSDIGYLLSAGNMHVERLITYEAVASEQLSDTLVEQLRRRQLDAVTFLSPRAAQIFMALLHKAGMREAITSLRCFCMSEAIADSLRNQPWQQVHIAPEATLASLVECVDNALAA